jgi:AraC-like DNA-binding protein
MKNNGMCSWEPWSGRKSDSYSIIVGEKIYWDGNGATSKQHFPPHTKLTATTRPASLLAFSNSEAGDGGAHVTQSLLGSDEVQIVPSYRTPRRTWKKIAALATFLLDPFLLGHGPGDADLADLGVKGELAWALQKEHTSLEAPSGHPAVLVYTTSSLRQSHGVEIVPRLQPHDPLFQHLLLVLQADRATQSEVERLYAESLTNALAVHFLKRYAGAEPIDSPISSGLPPHKLRRAIAYIDEHLEQELSLAKIAAVTHTSVTHFLRLFRQDTGMTPHQFVIWRRIERARQLLVDTELSLSEIGNRVGFTDQSHFIAVFRKHVGLTPRLYRRTTSSMVEEV